MSEDNRRHSRQIAETGAAAPIDLPSRRPAVPGTAPFDDAIPEANAYVVEVDGQTVGIVARDEASSYRFHASVNRFNSLEGRSFKSPREAERAAHQLARGRLKKARPLVPRARFALALT
jgi:hypothetical protein